MNAPRTSIYLQQTSPSETALTTMSGSVAGTSDINLPGSSRAFGSLGRSARRSFIHRPLLGSRNTDSDLETPSLYSAYHLSVKQATLTAPTLPADSILYLAEAAANAQEMEPQPEQPKPSWRNKDKSKKADDKKDAPYQWTSAIYLLTLRGSLLQYTADGHYERTPEKVLQLTSKSAAFVTDCIPGQHWVLRISDDISNAMNPTPAPLTESLFGKELSKRASNFLMVFDNADEMDSWITTVRTEIRKLKEAEAQAAKSDEGHGVRERSSQTTLTQNDVPRPGSRMSAVRTSIAVSDGDKNERDDLSVTNSVVSQEGQQLDSLRDSGHRLSVLSSGQQTYVTSAASSPASSPTLESYPRSSDEVSCGPETPVATTPRETDIQVRPKSANEHRNLVPPPESFAKREAPKATYSLIPLDTIPVSKFNLPGLQRRLSHSNVSSDSTPISPPRENPVRRQLRSKPPPAMRDARPLSVVADMPSPQASHSETMGTAAPYNALASYTPMHSTHHHHNLLSPNPPPVRRASMSHQEPSIDVSYIRKARRSSLRPHDIESRPKDLAPPAPPPSAPLPPLPTSTAMHNLRASMQPGDPRTRSLSVRRSMPQVMASLQPPVPRPSRLFPSVPQM